MICTTKHYKISSHVWLILRLVEPTEKTQPSPVKWPGTEMDFAVFIKNSFVHSTDIFLLAAVELYSATSLILWAVWKLLVGNPSCWVTSGKPLCFINLVWEKNRAVITIKLASLEGLQKKGLCEDKLVIFIVIISPPGAFWRILSDLSGSCPWICMKWARKHWGRGGGGEHDQVDGTAPRVTSYLPPDVQTFSKYHYNLDVLPFSILAKLWEASKTSEF